MYKDLRKERHKMQMLSLQKASQNNAKISKKMHNFDNGIEYEYDLDEKDERTNYERNADVNQIRQQIGAKLNVLFDNDADEVYTFMEYINENNISISQFNTAYPELLKNSNPSTNTVTYLLPKFKQLIENNYYTGNTSNSSIIKDIYDLVQRVFESGETNLNESDADDFVDRLEASAILDDSVLSDDDSVISSNSKSSFIQETQKIMTKNISEVEKMLEMDKMMIKKRREKQAKLSNSIEKHSKVTVQNFDTADSKKHLKDSLKVDQLKTILLKNEIPTSGLKKDELVDIVWGLTHE
jgi:hypothetical protein